MEKERQKWLNDSQQSIYYSKLYQDTTAIKHMLEALSNNLTDLRGEENDYD